MKGHGNDRVECRAARKVAAQLQRDEPPEVLRQTRLAAVLEPSHRRAEGTGMRASRTDREAAFVADRLALDAAGNADPAPGLFAAGTARRQQDVADPERELHHLAAASDEMSSSPACVPVRAAVLAGSSSTLVVPRGAPTAGTQGRRFGATRRPRIDPSRKSASIANRMKNIGIDPVSGMPRPSPSASPDGGRSRKRRARKRW